MAEIALQRRGFALPATGHVFAAAGAVHRLAAFAVDILLYLAVAPATLGFTAVVLRGLWPLGAAAALFAYFALSYVVGQSPGMRLLGLSLVDVRNGRPPGAWRAATRAALTTAPVVAAAMLASNSLRAPAVATEVTLQTALAYTAACVVLASVVSQFCALADPAGRSLADRWSRLATVATAGRDGSRAHLAVPHHP